MAVDKIKPLKIENAATGGTQNDPFPVEADPAQDYVAAKGIAFENSDTRLFDLSAGGEIEWKDAGQATYKTLNSIVASVGTLTNYEVDSSTAFITTSVTAVLITGMTLTPVAGTYFIAASCSVTQAVNNTTATITLYKAGAAIANSARTATTFNASGMLNLSTQTIITANGTDVFQLRANTSAGGTTTVGARGLTMIRIGA